MISLKVNGISIPVKQQPIQFRFKSPLLHKLDGSVVYRIEIPISPVSREVFGYVDRLSSRSFGDTKTIVGELMVKGVLLGEVSLSVDSTSANHYVVSAGINRGLFNFYLKEVDLRELLKADIFNLPTTNTTRLQLFTASSNTLLNSLPFIMFPCKLPKAFDDQNGWQFAEAERNAYVYQNPTNFATDGSVLNNYPVTPFFKVNYLLRRICELLGYSLIRNDLERIGDFSRLVVWSNNLQFVTGWAFNNSKSFWRTGDFVPKMPVLDFIQAIELICNGKLVPDSTKRQASFILTDDAFDPIETIDLQLPKEQPREVDFLQKKSSFRFKFTNPPDEVYGQYVKDYRNGEYTFKGQVNNEASLPAVGAASYGDVYQSISTGAYYALVANDSQLPEWQFLSLDLLDFLIGDNDSREEFECKASPVINLASNFLTPTGEILSMPTINTSAIGNVYRGPYVDSGLRLIFFRGLGATSPNQYPYPLGSSDIRELAGPQIVGATHAIKWSGTGGAIQNFYAKKLEWLKKGYLPVKFQRKLTMAELASWRWEVGYSIHSRKSICSLIEGEITPKGIVNAQMEFYPL